MCLWAIVSTLTALSKDFTGLVLTRFFLGVTEAPYYPGALYMLSIFYTRKEIATRISILYTGNILATAFAGLIALGIFEMGGMAGLSGWRWLFIIQGLVSQFHSSGSHESMLTGRSQVTFVVALVSLFVLPDDPTKTWWLTPEERELAQSRMDRDTVGNQGKTSTWKGLREAIKDKVGGIHHKRKRKQHRVLDTDARFTEALGVRVHAAHAHRGQRIQELLPHRRWHARLQQDHHARSDLPAVSYCRHHLGVLVCSLR